MLFHSQIVKGSYILIIRLPEQRTIRISNRQAFHLSLGYYAYVGSAMGGFRQRLSRYLQGSQKLHWHIDYLLQKAFISSIILCATNERVECTIAQTLSSKFSSVPGFGSSDCRCRSHLFFALEERQMKSTIMAALSRLALEPKLVKYID